jgi:hypothetical protein
MKWRDGSETASGIHVVPDPIRSIETPSGSGTIGMPFIGAVSADAVPGIDGIAFIEVSRRPAIPGIDDMVVSRPGFRILGMFFIDALSRDESGFMLPIFSIAFAVSRIRDMPGIPGIESFVAPRREVVESRSDMPGIFAMLFAAAESVECCIGAIPPASFLIEMCWSETAPRA